MRLREPDSSATAICSPSRETARSLEGCGHEADRSRDAPYDSSVRVDLGKLNAASALSFASHVVEAAGGAVPSVAETRQQRAGTSTRRRKEKYSLGLRLETDPAPIRRAGDSIDLERRSVAGEDRVGRAAARRNLQDRPPVFGPVDVENPLAVGTPDRRVRVRGQTSRRAPEGRRDPEIAAVGACGADERPADLDQAGAGGARRDESDRIAVRRERGLDVLCGVVGHVDVLAPRAAANVDFEVAASIRAVGQQTRIRRPGGPLGARRIGQAGEPGHRRRVRRLRRSNRRAQPAATKNPAPSAARRARAPRAGISRDLFAPIAGAACVVALGLPMAVSSANARSCADWKRSSGVLLEAVADDALERGRERPSGVRRAPAGPPCRIARHRLGRGLAAERARRRRASRRGSRRTRRCRSGGPPAGRAPARATCSRPCPGPCPARSRAAPSASSVDVAPRVGGAAWRGRSRGS